MSFPNVPDKYGGRVVFTAADVLARRWRGGRAPALAPPETVIFCYQPGLVRYAIRQYRAKRVGGFFGDLYRLRPADGRAAVVSGFGVGAPVVAVLVEELAAFGVRQFISIGIAGGLQDRLQAGDAVLANRAIRDEGVSHHYLPAEKYVAASAALTQRLRQALAGMDLTYQAGTTWTTDAPYRETEQEVAQYQGEGVLAVEMETAALFAVAQYLGVEAAAAFSIGDSLAGGRWQLNFDERRTNESLKRLLDTAVRAIGG